MKTGHKVLFSSHRNSIAGHTDLLRKTDCTLLLHSSDFPVDGILEAHTMRSFIMLDLDAVFSDHSSEPYYFTKSWHEACEDPCMVIHTSGSTGLPKPIVWTHSTLGTVDAHHLLSPLDGREVMWSQAFKKSRRTYIALPIFHGAGLATGIVQTVFFEKTIVLGPPGLPGPDVFNLMFEHANIDGANCVPSTLEEISQVPGIVAKLAKLECMTYVGGQLSKTAGDIISKKTHLISVLASTETSVIVQYATDWDDWDYFCIPTSHNGIEFRRYSSTSNLYELIFVNNSDAKIFQGIFKVFPKLEEYSRSDLYSARPTKPHHWRHEGRADDMIVLASGWNVNPVIHEQLISSHPAVQRCILTGTGNYKLAALIELQPGVEITTDQERHATLDLIWQKVREANALADSAGQLEKDDIIFATPAKPFLLSGKGSIQRPATLQLYKDELQKVHGNTSR